MWLLTAAILQLPAIFLEALLWAIPMVLAFTFATWVFDGRHGDRSQDIPNDLWDW